MDKKSNQEIGSKSQNNDSAEDAEKESKGMSGGAKFCAYLLVTGLFFTAIYYFSIYFSFYSTAVQASGTILSATSNYSRHDRFWKLLVQFDAPEEKNNQIVLEDHQLNPNAYVDNESISFYYNPKDPMDARIDPPMAVVMHGVVFLILGFYGFYSVRKFS
jgi:hypothetical protein